MYDDDDSNKLNVLLVLDSFCTILFIMFTFHLNNILSSIKARPLFLVAQLFSFQFVFTNRSYVTLHYVMKQGSLRKL